MMQKHRTATPPESDADVTFEVGSGNVYADLGLPDAEELQAKGDLAHLIINIVEDRGWKQKRAASEIGIAESEMSDIMNGKLRRFSRERLEHNLTTLVMTFSVPQMFGDATSGACMDKGGINTNPAMNFEGAKVNAHDGKGNADIMVQRHGGRPAAEVTGTIANASEDKSSFGDWKRTTADYTMTLDPVAFSDGVLRVGLATNDMIVERITKERK